MAREQRLKNYVLSSKLPGALYSHHTLKKVPGIDFSTDELKRFFSENDTLRQFYSASNLPKRLTVRNAVSAYPLERVHIDLCEMTKKHGMSNYKYILFAIDNFSRFVFYVLLKSKQPKEMGAAAKSLLTQMLPFRHSSFNQQSTFLADLGTEFITQFKEELLKRNHLFVNLASSKSKAFYAERFIRTFRELLKVKQTSLDLEKKDFDNWALLVPDIVEIYNASPHRGLNFKSPSDAIKLDLSTVEMINRIKPAVSKNDFLKSINFKRDRSDFKFGVGTFVRLTQSKNNVFSKVSEKLRIGLEIFKVYKVRQPIMNLKKLPIYFVEDLKGKKIAGGFQESELVKVDENSVKHPQSNSFRPTIRNVISKRSLKGQTLFKVSYNGNLFSYYFLFF